MDDQQPIIESVNGNIRVVDDEGRLLFIYNAHTRCIEFIPSRGGKGEINKRRLCIVSTDALRSVGMRNVISSEPVVEFQAEVVDVQ